jgi:sugar (pentulose or hexulose) kinase
MKNDAGTIGALFAVHCAGAIFRGIMESSAFEFRRLLGEKMPDPASLREIFMVGGPASSAPWRQILADTLDRTVWVRFASNAGAVGAALTAARQAGCPVSMREKAVEVVPRETAVKALDERYKRFLGLHQERN